MKNLTTQKEMISGQNGRTTPPTVRMELLAMRLIEEDTVHIIGIISLACCLLWFDTIFCYGSSVIILI